MKLCSACVKQSTAVKTVSVVCSLFKYTLSDLVGQRPSLLILNFEQVIKPFFVSNVYFTFFLPLDDCTFYTSTIKSNCLFL